MVAAKLFRNGGSQAVRLPRDMAFEGQEVIVRRIGRHVLLSPKEDPWGSLLDSLSMFTDDFMAERDQDPPQERELFG